VLTGHNNSSIRGMADRLNNLCRCILCTHTQRQIHTCKQAQKHGCHGAAPSEVSYRQATDPSAGVAEEIARWDEIWWRCRSVVDAAWRRRHQHRVTVTECRPPGYRWQPRQRLPLPLSVHLGTGTIYTHLFRLFLYAAAIASSAPDERV